MRGGEILTYTKMLLMIQKALQHTTIDWRLSSEMANQIDLWTRMFENRAPWLSKTVESAGLSAAIASEVARLITLELVTEVSGSARATYINDAYQKTVKKLRQYVEYGCAKGGLIFKPYYTHDGIDVQMLQADSFFPVTFDGSGAISQCIFLEQFRIGNKIYSRIEMHTLQGTKLIIENHVFVSTNDFSLGSEIPITSVKRWRDIAQSLVVDGVTRLPFGYFKFPLANTRDSDSPLGVSVYSRAIGLIREADRRYSQINWEYEAKEAAVHAATSMMRYNPDTDKFEYPGGKDRLYRTVEVNSGATEKPLLEEYSPDIRDASLYNGWNQQMRMIEFNCGLAYGTLSDPNNVDKTAEEIRSSKQRSYQMISDAQGALQNALEDLIEAIDFYCTLYDLAPAGRYATSFKWDDSIITDTNAIVDTNIKLTQASLRSKLRAIMEINRCSEEDAQLELDRIAGEGQITGQDIDWTEGDKEEATDESTDESDGS